MLVSPPTNHPPQVSLRDGERSSAAVAPLSTWALQKDAQMFHTRAHTLIIHRQTPAPKRAHARTQAHTHNTRRAGWCEHYPLDFRLPLHLTHTAHSCLLPDYTGNCSCCEIARNLLLSSSLLSPGKTGAGFFSPS